MTDPLVEFLRARLDEDEQAARDAQTAPPPRTPGGWPHETEILHGAAGMGVPDAVIGCYLAHGNPARVLAEVAAKRMLVDEYAELSERGVSPGPGWEELQGRLEGFEQATKMIATSWASHPGYRKEWAPDRD